MLEAAIHTQAEQFDIDTIENMAPNDNLSAVLYGINDMRLVSQHSFTTIAD